MSQMLRVTSLYPTFVNDEQNTALMEPVTLEELKEAIRILQKDKSPSPDGWPIEFFSSFLELFEFDLSRVIE